MAIGYAKRADMLEHSGHELEVGVYGTLANPHSVTIECIDCGMVLIDSEEDYEENNDNS